MSSVWGTSWGNSWGNSWGTTTITVEWLSYPFANKIYTVSGCRGDNMFSMKYTANYIAKYSAQVLLVKPIIGDRFVIKSTLANDRFIFKENYGNIYS